jgi:CPA1 family monovalent cation:H+ antiporter
MAVQSLFNLIALVVTLAAVFGWVNHRWLRLPHTIGLVLIALGVSVALLAVDALIPSVGIEAAVRGVLTEIEFEDTLMRGMLSFLLFAGALHVDLNQLLEKKWVILTMATVGIVISTVLVAFGSYFALALAGIDVPLSYCLVFGALISPTDPIAVLGILKNANVPDSLQAKIAGESLFNDGVGIVLFRGGGDPGADHP